MSQYDAKQRATVQAAIDSGVLNNTNRSHELVDLVAKISADKGAAFDFTNNEKLKETGFALEGVTVNGFVNDSGVTVNVQSAKTLNAVVGHEITHVLEGTELYDALAQTITEYAKAKGEYQSRYGSLAKLYAGIEGANVEAEVVADLVGDYLFTDKAFVQKLSTENRSLFKKLWDEVKYLCKVATAGSKEAKQLEKVKKAFEEAYRAETKNPTGEGGSKYSLMAFEKDGRRFVEIDQDQDRFDGHSADEYPGIAKEIIKEKFENKVVGIDNKMFVNGAGRSEFAYPSKPITDANLYEAKMRASPELDNLLDAGTNLRNEADGRDGHVHPDAVGGFDHLDTLFKIGNRYFEGRVNIKNIKRGKLFTDVTQIKDVTQAIMSSYGQNPKSQFLRTSSMDSIRNSDGVVNTKNSLSEIGQADDIAPPLPWQIKGQDVALENFAPIGENVVTKQNAVYEGELGPVREDAVATPREYISLEDYANNESPVWRNVGYADEGTKAAITQETHDRMVSSGAVVTVAEDVMGEVEKSFPDLRSMKKTERTPILKEAINKLKSNIRQFLTGLSNQSFEFEVNGKVLEAKLYSTGINEVLEKVTQEKANMLYSTEEIFRNAQYLYSTPDYDGDPNVYRWNYFYTPVQIGEEIVGVRIAVRDMAKGTDGATPQSQIYNWGIKKDASLDGGSHDPRAASSGVSSDASSNNIPQTPPNVNPDDSTGAAPRGKERKWVGTSTGSEAVDGKILPGDLDQELTYYQPISNKKTLGNANARLDNLGYDKAVDYFRNKVAADDVKLDDIALGERLIQEAVKKGDYDARLEQLTRLYEGKEGYTGEDAQAKIQQEVVADLVGDYLFTDQDFVNRLSTENRSLFKKLWDEVKYLCKVATAGSKEAKQLEKVKKAFEEAYRTETKNPTGEGGTRYSISEIVDASGNNYGIGVHLDSTLLDNLTPEERTGMVKEYVKELGGSVFTAYDAAGNAVDVIIEKAGAKFKNKSGRKVSVNKDLTSYLDNEVKQEAIILVDELIQTSSYQGKEPATHPHDWLDNNGANDWDLWKTYIQDKTNTVWEASLRIANSANGEKILYDIFPIKKVEGAGTSATTTTYNNIAPTTQNVNNKNSLSENGQTDDIAPPLPWEIRGEDVALA